VNDQPFGVPPKHWPAKMTPWWYRMMGPVRRRAIRQQGIAHVEVQGLNYVQQSLEAKQGVLIAPNHSFHYDSYCLLEAAAPLKIPFYIMSAWQVFALSRWWDRISMQRCGVFSVDREGTDMVALKTAIDILQNRSYPLVVFPEGDIYHMNERVTPFRDGAGAMAIMAARKGTRPIAAIPVAIRRCYVRNPTLSLCETMEKIERRLYWLPMRGAQLKDRILRVAQGLLALKEIEHFGESQSGVLTDRIQALMNKILLAAEERYAIANKAILVPERIKQIRRAIIDRREETLDASESEQQQWSNDMEAMFLATQLYSYPGNYVGEHPSVERLAETVDKLEEDVLGVTYPTLHSVKRVIVRFGEPITIEPGKEKKLNASELTDRLEKKVQVMLDDLASCRFEST